MRREATSLFRRFPFLSRHTICLHQWSAMFAFFLKKHLQHQSSTVGTTPTTLMRSRQGAKERAPLWHDIWVEGLVSTNTYYLAAADIYRSTRHKNRNFPLGNREALGIWLNIYNYIQVCVPIQYSIPGVIPITVCYNDHAVSKRTVGTDKANGRVKLLRIATDYLVFTVVVRSWSIPDTWNA